VGRGHGERLIETEDKTARVVLSGDIVVYRSGTIAAKLPDPSSVSRVIVDCSSVSYADSTFVTALIRYRRAFVEAGNDPLNIVIIAGQSVQRIFEILGLTRSFTFVAPKNGATAARLPR
jgi:anti-anti-sigma regulatory factor